MSAVNIAHCPEHGLHGHRKFCYVCGGLCEQVAMVPVEAVAQERERIVTALRHHGHPGDSTAFYEAADFIEKRLTPALARTERP